MSHEQRSLRPRKQALSFKGKIIQKGSTNDALLKRLRSVQTSLAEMDQEDANLDSLAGVSKELIEPTLMLHKDKGVKAALACCLADILRLYAPDAPYTVPELKDIFDFFFRQLRGLLLEGMSSPFYNDYFYLLESLSNVKSVVLVCDLPNGDELMAEVFRNFFDGIGDNLSKNVEICMSDILVQLLDECTSVPNEVLDILLAQFLPKNKIANAAAYRMATDVCNATADRLQKHVCQYFTEAIVTASKSPEDPSTLEELHTTHSLIKQLNRSVPSLLLNVIPQLEEELRVDDNTLRGVATGVLGEMFAEKDGAAAGGELARRYASTWKAWLGRRLDRASAVRVVFVEALKDLMVNKPELRTDVQAVTKEKLIDNDEKVRLAMCQVFSSIDYEIALHHVDKDVLMALGERCKDKKKSVQRETLRAVSRLFDLACPEIERQDPAAIDQFAWMPGMIVSSFYVGDVDLSFQAESILLSHILPLPSNGDEEVAWVDRLLLVLKYLLPGNVKALLFATQLQVSRPGAFDRFLDFCEKYNGGVMDDNEKETREGLHRVIQQVARTFPDPKKAASDMLTFSKMNEKRIYRLFRTCFDPQTDLKGLLKARAEVLKKIEQNSPSIKETFDHILRRGSFFFINKSSIPALVKRLQKSDGSNETSNAEVNAKNASVLLEFVSKYSPVLYKAHVSELVKALSSDRSNERLVRVCLGALSSLAQHEPNAAPSDRRALEQAVYYVQKGTPLQARYAAKLLALMQGKESDRQRRTKILADALPSATGETLVAHLHALSQIVKFAPEAFEESSDKVMQIILKDILMKSSSGTKTRASEDDDWVADEDMDASLRAKLLGVEVITNRGLSFAKADNAEDMLRPVLKCLWAILDRGEVVEGNSPASSKSRMRLKSAYCLLKLARTEQGDKAIGKDFLNLAFLMQDPCFQVRQGFIVKHLKYLRRGQLRPRFNAIPFLVAYDPETENRTMVANFAIQQFRNLPAQARLARFETIFVRLLHLLAHHPDFSREGEDFGEEIRSFARYIEFYLDCIANSENVSLLFHLALKCKTVRDAESTGHSENLYTLSELAQHLIRLRASAHQWPLNTYPAKIQMPSDIFRSLPSKEVAQEVYRRNFFPPAVLQTIGSEAKRRPAESGDGTIKAVSKAIGTGARKKRARREKTRPKAKPKRRRYASEEEEESSLEEEEEEEEEEEGGDDSSLTSLSDEE